MLCLYILPVGYAIVWVKPSWDCGPFSGYEKIYHLATKQLTDSLPDPINKYCSIFYLKKYIYINLKKELRKNISCLLTFIYHFFVL